MATREYVQITKSTVEAARDRVLDDLNALTNGEAERAIRYVAEFNELEGICQKLKEKEQRLQEYEAANGSTVFYQ